MKKSVHIFYMTMLGTLATFSYVSASNPAFVPGIREVELTNLQVLADVDPTSLFVYNNSPPQNVSVQDTDQVIEISGALERLEKISSSTEETFTLEKITSLEELRNYIKVLVRQNPNLTLVVVKSGEISLTRSTSEKLFGFFDVYQQETATVKNWGDGTSAVSVTKPWWSIFSKSYSDDQIAEDLYLRIKTIPSSLFVPNPEVNTQARILTEIHGAFNENNLSNR
jgi:hypothetical protein